MDGADRSDRAQELTCAAAHAELFHHSRDGFALLILDHLDGSGRAVSRAVAACYIFSVREAELQIHDCASDVLCCLFLRCDGRDGTSRADL